MAIDTLMIFAAGLGIRMQPLTLEMPKPLVKVNGKSFLERALDLAATHDFKRVVINSHHLHNQISAFIKSVQKKYSFEIIEIYEETLLDTGGAVKNAMPYFSDQGAIFTLNADVILEPECNIFKIMEGRWNQGDVNFLMLTHPRVSAVGYKGRGDFLYANKEELVYDELVTELPHVFTGLQIIKPQIIAQVTEGKFSLSKIFRDPSYKKIGMVNPGKWYHASTMEDVKMLERRIMVDCKFLQRAKPVLRGESIDST